MPSAQTESAGEASRLTGAQSRMVAICLTQVIALAGPWWGGPPGPRGTPRPAAGSGGRGLRAGERGRPPPGGAARTALPDAAPAASARARAPAPLSAANCTDLRQADSHLADFARKPRWTIGSR